MKSYVFRFNFFGGYEEERGHWMASSNGRNQLRESKKKNGEINKTE